MHTFRVGNDAAPLKRREQAHRRASDHAFRVGNDAAPLKRMGATIESDRYVPSASATTRPH